jgi:hypothetical protein
MYEHLERLPLPKIISPKKHELLDYLTIGTFLLLGGLWWKNNRRASVAALANGLFVLSYTPFTDYEGNGRRPISFHTHGNLDRIQAGMAAAAPSVLRFKERSSFFRGQAINEAMVLAMTDFEAAKPGPRSLRAA